MKKKSGAMAKDYDQVEQTTGEITSLLPEFVACSLKPGIGHDWYQKHKADVHNHDYIVQNGKQYPVPKYYDKLLERENPDRMEAIRKRRMESAVTRAHDNTPQRLKQREKVKSAQLKKLPREYEE